MKGLNVTGTIISLDIDAESSVEASWVAGGTNGELHQSFIFIETVEGSKEVTLSNNKSQGYRSVTFSNENSNDVATESIKVAIRAKNIIPLIPKPTSEDQLTLSVFRTDEGNVKCNVTRDSRVISLNDMSPRVFDARVNSDLSELDKTFTVDFMEFSDWIKDTVSAIGSEGKFELENDNEDSVHTLSIVSGSPNSVSRVVLVGEQDESSILADTVVDAKAFSGIRNFPKMDGGEEKITGYVGEGIFALKAVSGEEYSAVKEVVYVSSSSLEDGPTDVDPFDSDRKQFLRSDDIAFVKEQVASVSGVSTSNFGALRIDTTGNGVVKLQVIDREGTAKSVSFEYVIQDSTVDVKVPLTNFNAALKGFDKDSQIQLSLTSDENDDQWVIISDESSNSDDEEDYDNEEFIDREIAIKCLKG